VSIWAFGAGEESWLLDHLQLWGSPAEAEVWRQLDAVLDRVFVHESGAKLRIRCMAIDSQGHHTEEVYRYTKTHRRRGVWPIQGRGEQGRAAVSPPAKKSKERLWALGSNALKDIIFARLKLETAGPGYMHFPQHVTPEYFRQLTSERKITTYLKGKPTRLYVPVEGRRHEALDCAQYALAALYMLGPVRDRLHLEAKRLEDAAKPAEPVASPAEPASILPQLRRPRVNPKRNWVNRW
jgi:phage terminase large subunit GpA-like protein